MNSATRHAVIPVGRPPAIRRDVLLLLGFYEIELHAGIARYAREAGWAINNQYARTRDVPAWWSGDGILGLITTPKDVRAMECFPGLPMVDLSKGWISDSMPEQDRPSGVGRPRVLYDNIGIARLAAEHFLQRGFKHVAYFNVGNYYLEAERIPTLRQLITEGGGDFHEIAYHRQLPAPGSRTPEHQAAAYAWLVKTLAQLPKPIGIVTPGDDDGVLLLKACSDAGVAVPEEVGILGCDNDPLICDFTPVPLSSIDSDWDRIGYEGARLLDRLMDGEAAPSEPILIPPKGVVTRQSTNILAVPDSKIARALRFIWEHFPDPINIPEVAKATGMNRRTLERGFRLHLRRSVNEEILRVRIEHAKKLLLETRKKNHEVANEAGFSSATALSVAFTRVTGMRPGAFRRGKAAEHAVSQEDAL